MVSFMSAPTVCRFSMSLRFAAGNFNFADDTFSGRNTRGDTTAFRSHLTDP